MQRSVGAGDRDRWDIHVLDGRGNEDVVPKVVLRDALVIDRGQKTRHTHRVIHEEARMDCGESPCGLQGTRIVRDCDEPDGDQGLYDVSTRGQERAESTRTARSSP